MEAFTEISHPFLMCARSLVSLGDSFTVHNDKDFEREVLTANYRHGKFSSFQRQLNMYGFRKVPDCSDRTYSHPFFRRNCPQLLKKVRRVVPGNNSGSSGGVGRVRTPALPPMSGLGTGMGTAGLGTAHPGTTVEESRVRANADPGNGGDRLDARPPARKKTRMCVPRTLSGSSSAGGGSSVGGMFSRPHQDWGDDAGVLRNAAAVRQAKRSSVAAQALLRQAPPALPPPPPPPASAFSSPRSSTVTSGSSNASQHEFSSSWHHHTGLWGGVTNTFDERWTSGSSSAASSVDPSSPVLLPINTADIESRDSIPPFNLPPAEAPAATVAVPAPVSPTITAAGAASTASGGGVGFGFDGMLAPVARKSGATRTVSPTERGMGQKTAYGTWSSCVANVTSNGTVSRAGSGGACGGVCDTGNDGSLQQALGFGQAIACRQPFDLGFNSDLANGRSGTTGTNTSKENPVPISPPSTTADGTVTSAGSSIGWEISSVGRAGWGSPGTVDSVAAAQWAALPPFHGGNGPNVGNGSSIRSPRTPVGAGGGAPPGTPSTSSGNGLGAASMAGAVGDVSGRDLTQQQQPFAPRSLSTPAAVESIDWALLEDGYNDDDDASFSGLASPQGFDVDAFCETSNSGGCDVSRALAPLSPTDLSLALQSPSPTGSGFPDGSTHATSLAVAAGRMSTPLGDESWALGSSATRSMFA